MASFFRRAENYEPFVFSPNKPFRVQFRIFSNLTSINGLNFPSVAVII